MNSLRGQFLLASPTLKDPIFLRSVVLVVRHDDDGALGVIINRPLDVTVADAIGEGAAASVDQLLHKGGPCDGPMMVLHAEALDASEEVVPGVRFTHARDDIEQVMAEPDRPARYIVGYAGWQADQLEQEMAEGSWVVIPASPADVFSSTVDLWQRLSSRAGLLKFVPPDRIPDDPRLN